MKILEFLKNKKGAMGIGTLIIFIAMVLVAAVAASVLINTSGFLQQKASSTGKESTEQVAGGLLCYGVRGHIFKSGNIFYDLDKMVMYISPNSGSAPIDLKESKLFLTYDGKSVVLKYSDIISATDGSQDVFSLTNGFAINYSNVTHPVTTTNLIDDVSSAFEINYTGATHPTTTTTLINGTVDKINITSNNANLLTIFNGLRVGDIVTMDTNATNWTPTTATDATVVSVTNLGTGDYEVIMNFSTNVVNDASTTTILPNTDWVKLNGSAYVDKIKIATTNSKLKTVLKGLSAGDSVTVLSNNTITSENTTTVDSISYDGTTFTVIMNFANYTIISANATLGTSDWVKLNGTAVWGGADDKSFLIAPLQDNDNSVVNGGVINKGDFVAILVNSEAAFDTEIPERTRVLARFQPEFGAPAVVDFTTPIAYTKEIMELQ
ncbi:flagellin protein [Methanococcus aeolicus Nankai-3]|jgi:flagellin FlaB|uniref:Flagellin n=1 Tax=Methanococcus aeolicus (strain ATCC BAA-1280 / DSM 17508 / OCM 812 / Nankai-3) TaxID=419665 RepID=A6UTM4_META3|nr:flagellin protein [Methanococcus aeolicus Nankai-3]